MPPAPPIVTGELLDLRAAETPEATAIVFVDGPSWSWAELRARVRAHAAALQALGVRQGELVLSWLPNGPLAVLNFLALGLLGAVSVAINTAYRGGVLAHVLKNSGARLMIAHGGLIDRLAEVDAGALERIVVVGDERPALPGIALLDRAALEGDAAGLRPPPRPIAPTDLRAVIYTSGTTGPAKGVLASYRHLNAAALGFRNVGPRDRSLNMLPMFHVGGPLSLNWALVHGGSVVFAESFRTSEFWPIVRRHDVTTTGLLGAMARFLLDRPPMPEDREHPLRSVIIAPFDEAALRFGERFGVEVYTEYNMTELAVPLWAGPNPTALGACGRPSPGVTLNIVDDEGGEVPAEATGELLVRMDDPSTIAQGYLNDPAATAETWRDGWFLTGDLFRRDADDNYFFIDRKKDSIRRRGENISSFEVESALLLHPGVREAAVVAAPGEGSEDEVLAVVVSVAQGSLDPAELIDFLRPRLAHFMVPRYVRLLDALPRTPTHKVEKHRLRAEGVTADTWDREAAGVVVRRERLEGRG
jgi:crotonobetaine/carnitine-CoA ligase